MVQARRPSFQAGSRMFAFATMSMWLPAMRIIGYSLLIEPCLLGCRLDLLHPGFHLREMDMDLLVGGLQAGKIVFRIHNADLHSAGRIQDLLEDFFPRRGSHLVSRTGHVFRAALDELMHEHPEDGEVIRPQLFPQGLARMYGAQGAAFGLALRYSRRAAPYAARSRASSLSFAGYSGMRPSLSAKPR